MKKRFGKLPKSERLKIEAQYHRMKPEDLNKPMSHARRHSPSAIRLPPELVESLKMVAESEGEPEYQAMVRRWIEERLRQENVGCGTSPLIKKAKNISRAAFAIQYCGAISQRNADTAVNILRND